MAKSIIVGRERKRQSGERAGAAAQRRADERAAIVHSSSARRAERTAAELNAAEDTGGIFSDLDLAAMAEALSVPVARVEAHRLALDAAARQYAMLQPSKTPYVSNELAQLEGACGTILAMLDVNRIEAAEDGPGPMAEPLARALALVNGEESIRHAVWSVGQLMAAAAKARKYQTLATQREIDESHGSTCRDPDPGVRLAIRRMLAAGAGDLSLEAFAGQLLRVYEDIVGKQPTVTKSPTTNVVSGRALKFIDVAMRPVGATITGNQLDYLVRSKGKSQAKKSQ